MKSQDPKFLVIPVAGPLHGTPMLFVADYKWWVENQEEIESWMDQNLRLGREHLQGMVITFDTNDDRALFMLRFGL